MNDSSGRQQLFAIPGDGVLAREGDLVLLTSIDERGLLDRLLELLTRAAADGDDGRRFTGAVGSMIENDETWGSPDGQRQPAVVAFGRAGAGLAVTVTGTAWADIITSHGAHRVMAGQPSTLLHCVVGAHVQAVRAGLETGGGRGERTDRFSRLEAGTVRAGGLSYHAALPAAAPAAAAAPPAQAPAPPGGSALGGSALGGSALGGSALGGSAPGGSALGGSGVRAVAAPGSVAPDAPVTPAFEAAAPDGNAVMPGNGAALSDAASGNAAVGDAAPGDAAPGDAARSDPAPGNAALGDAAPGDAAPGDAARHDEAQDGAALADARSVPLGGVPWDEPADAGPGAATEQPGAMEPTAPVPPAAPSADAVHSPTDLPGETPAAEPFTAEPFAAEPFAADSPAAEGAASESQAGGQPACELPASDRETMWPPMPDPAVVEPGLDAPVPAAAQSDLAEPPSFPPAGGPAQAGPLPAGPLPAGPLPGGAPLGAPLPAGPLHAAVPQAGPLPGPPGPFPGAQPGQFPGAQPEPFPAPQPGPYPGAQPGSFPGAQPVPFPAAQPGQFPGAQQGPLGGPFPGPAHPMTEVAQVPGLAAAPPAAPGGAAPMGAASFHEATGPAGLPVREPTGPAHVPPPVAGGPGDGAVPGTNPPIVLGVFCKNGHFGDPETRNCAMCGASRRRGQAPQPGPRPPLGALVLDDNSALVLDADAIVGRDPAQDPAVAAGEARPLRIEDEEMTVSRIHARVHLEGWRVYLVDLGSANGTRVLVRGARGEQLLQPNVPVLLQGGTRIFVGTQGFRYESGPGR